LDWIGITPIRHRSLKGFVGLVSWQILTSIKQCAANPEYINKYKKTFKITQNIAKSQNV